MNRQRILSSSKNHIKMFAPNSLSSVTSGQHQGNNGQSTSSVDNNNSSNNHRVQSTSRQQMTGSPYLSGYSGYNSVSQHPSTPSGYASHHHQDPYGMYPMDPAMAWHAAYTAGHLYRGYEAASLVAADPGAVWPPPPSHHQMGNGPSGFSSIAGNATESSCNNLNLPSNNSVSAIGGNEGPTSMGDTTNLTHNIGGNCKGETDSVSPPPSDYKPSILYGNSNNGIGSHNQKKNLTTKVSSADENADSERMTNATTSITRGNHGSGGSALHPSPDSGVAISDNVSSSGSPNHPMGLSLLAAQGVAINGQSAIAALGTSSSGVSGDLMVGHQSSGGKSTQNNNDGEYSGLSTSRPQPVRSPYEWMKRPSFQTRTTGKEGGFLGRTRTKDKYRVVYSDHQRLELEKEFHYSRYITIRRKSELAQGLSLTERQVKIWFQNRRAKERKHMKKRDELMQKEKLDVAASFHAGQLAAGAAAHMNTIAAFNAGMPPMHLAHPGVMSAAAAASSAAALSHL